MAATSVVLGIGCQRGVSKEMLMRGIDEALRVLEIQGARVRLLATTAKKRDEVGLLELARERGWSIAYHDDLGDAVAEPAAQRHGQLLMGKRIYREENLSMTVAIAELRE